LVRGYNLLCGRANRAMESDAKIVQNKLDSHEPSFGFDLSLIHGVFSSV